MAIEVQARPVAAGPLTAQQVADFIIRELNDAEPALTNIRLQALLYFVQAWHLARYDAPLFAGPIMAQAHGPAVPDVWRHYADELGLLPWQPLPLPAPVALPLHAREHILDVLETYAGLSEFQMERYIDQDGPWLEARRGYLPDEASDIEIDSATVKAFYQAMPQDDPA